MHLLGLLDLSDMGRGWGVDTQGEGLEQRVQGEEGWTVVPSLASPLLVTGHVPGWSWGPTSSVLRGQELMAGAGPGLGCRQGWAGSGPQPCALCSHHMDGAPGFTFLSQF